MLSLNDITQISKYLSTSVVLNLFSFAAHTLILLSYVELWEGSWLARGVKWEVHKQSTRTHPFTPTSHWLLKVSSHTWSR